MDAKPCVSYIVHMNVAVRERHLTGPRWSLVKAKADELSAPYSAPPIPVLEIAENNGVDVVFASFGSASDKVAGFCDFEGASFM